MKNFNVAVDVGRSAVKVAFSNKQFSFPSVFSYQRNNLTGSQLVLNKQDPHEAEIDGTLYLFGETARTFGSFVFEGSEGDSFREVSCKTALYCVARALLVDGFRQMPEITLAINLTYDNFFQKKAYQELLRGQHTVTVKDAGTLQFNVGTVFVLYQGYSGLLDHAMDSRTFMVGSQFTESSGLIVDVGRRTVDISYVESLTVQEGKSYDFGTYKVLERVSEELRSKYEIMKEIYEIEAYILKGRKFKTLTGREVDPATLSVAAAQEFSSELLFILRSFFSKKTPDYLLLMGGGASIYESALKKQYPTIQTLKNPAFANASGMLKFLNRVSAENV